MQEKFRLCSTCGDAFLDIKQNWKRVSKKKNTGTCKVCVSEYQAIYYKNNTEKVLLKNKEWRDRRKG